MIPASETGDPQALVIRARVIGAFRDTPIFLGDGDVVEIEIDRIGTLVNPATSAP